MNTTIGGNYSHGTRRACATWLTAIAISVCCCGATAAHGTGSGNGGAAHAIGGFSGGSHGRKHRGTGWRDRVGDRGIRTARADVGGQRGWLIPGHGYFFASLPPYCTLLYWQGTGFYYANGVYYGWDGTVGGYQEVEPPAGLAQRVDSQQAAEADLFVFPVEGQSNVQTEADRAECDRWAVTQLGADPRQASATNQAFESSASRESRLRATRQCLEARHYTVQ